MPLELNYLSFFFAFHTHFKTIYISILIRDHLGLRIFHEFALVCDKFQKGFKMYFKPI